MNRLCDMHTAKLSACICRGPAGEGMVEDGWMDRSTRMHTKMQAHTHTHTHTYTHARAHTHTNLVGACIVHDVLQEEQHCLQSESVLAGEQDEEGLHGLQSHGTGDNWWEGGGKEEGGGRSGEEEVTSTTHFTHDKDASPTYVCR